MRTRVLHRHSLWGDTLLLLMKQVRVDRVEVVRETLFNEAKEVADDSHVGWFLDDCEELRVGML